jgi:hypothetical protein
MDTYLGQLLGSGHIPLKYVICTQATPDLNAIYATTQAQLIALAPLNGDSFNRDNARVYGLIQAEHTSCILMLLPMDEEPGMPDILRILVIIPKTNGIV